MFRKKFLIYGLGKSGISTYNFLKKKNELYLYDDNENIFRKKFKKLFIKLNNISKKNFDYIVISPGIDINKCKLKLFLKKNFKKIITDLDLFYKNFNNNKNITITGTNGKSTTAKILFDLFKKEKKDVRLTGNIGNPILSEKKITSKTIFVIEASSYQIEYSKYFKANYALILNISPDHLERHKTFENYVRTKFKLFKNQRKNDYSFFNFNNLYLKRYIKKNKLSSKLNNVNNKLINKHFKKIHNPYFLTHGNKQNLSFIFAVAKKFNLKKSNILKVINEFKGLKFRQQIIYQSTSCTIINDSKATSYSSSENILKSLKKVYWILGGVPKKGDRFLMSKKQCKNFKAYIFGKRRKYFMNQLKKKMNCKSFISLNDVIKKINEDLKTEKNSKHNTILFSPSAASFDDFKNFEERGKYFNFLIKKYKIEKTINAV